MRVIVEAFGRAFILQYGCTDGSEGHEPEFQEAPPQDPHSVHGGQVEHSEPVSASFHASDPVARRFGFHGRQDSGE